MTAQTLERPSVNQTAQAEKILDVLIIGTGFAGLCMGIRLKKAGIGSFVILEKGNGVGGTWRENTYPGAACDVQSHLYSFSFAPKSNWSRLFGPQREILDYMNDCTDRFGIRSHIRTNVEVNGARFDEKLGIWEISTANGEVYKAKAVVSGTGGLSRPVLPNIKGIDTFKGAKFHSAKWDHNYNLEGKTVAVIGTGASAIQIVPTIAPIVGTLKLFQRTPPWIIPKPDAQIGSSVKGIFKFIPPLRWLFRKAIYWINEIGVIAFAINPKLMKIIEKFAKNFIAKSIPNPELRQKLTPTYTIGCKRILLSNDYYPALNRENVELVTDGIEEITASGVKTKDGKEHKVDAIIFATGFQAAEAVSPFEIRGRNGQLLSDAWEDGAEAYLGTTISGFPNLFMIVGPNTGLGHSSMILMIESQVQYALQGIRYLRKKNIKFMDVRKDVQDRFNAEIQDRLSRSVWTTGGCVSWYNTSTGRNTTLWPGFTFEFKARTFFLRSKDYEFVRVDGKAKKPSFGSRFSMALNATFG
ncbi:NAD(P)/FAD-dependent oxidoreductase [Leptospira langatensis]|uniref:NAD(P)/FAD-dependent oxidoreductase n=1 Tax=Leptospira langatensis TaxID=2484983 RepID=A0A5F1ZUZ5_9LEPT|nr:NAD(P)/FAD-dependent oxidoreductase [Leptospira langatensis]TGK02903.1 NAD(P)/FAD-dependent oxidoreductase [Leptospira langatensis]TGL41658.1 NAD(P)/FAD-dependent oxidoreductase [Leptospira langatensis]